MPDRKVESIKLAVNFALALAVVTGVFFLVVGCNQIGLPPGDYSPAGELAPQEQGIGPGVGGPATNRWQNRCATTVLGSTLFTVELNSKTDARFWFDPYIKPECVQLTASLYRIDATYTQTKSGLVSFQLKPVVYARPREDFAVEIYNTTAFGGFDKWTRGMERDVSRTKQAADLLKWARGMEGEQQFEIQKDKKLLFKGDLFLSF